MMNSAVLWIILPFIFGLFLLTLIGHRRLMYYTAALITILLTSNAIFFPIEKVVKFGPLSFKIASSLTVLGRRLVLTSDNQTILIMLYTITLFWIVGGLATKSSEILPPVALMMTALLTASLAVQPFLYAAILIEGAVLVSLPLFEIKPGRKNPGVVRYLVFQTIGLPFLLMTGWIMGGLQTGAADPEDAVLAVVFLGLGFGFVLAIFPLYSWIPMLAEEEDPFATGFVYIMLPAAILFSLLAYVDQYSWLRESLDLPRIFQVAGVIMIVTGGIWCAFQRNLARMFGYAVIVENGLAVLSLGLMTVRGYQLFANLLLTRMIAFGLWALCLSLIRREFGSLRLTDVAGLGRRFPILAVGLMAAQFSVGGLPLLAGFPLRTAIVEELAIQSPNLAWVMLLGIAGVWAGGLYSLYILIRGHVGVERIWLRNRLANVLILVGVVLLVVMGLFPNLYAPLMNNLLLPFKHLTGV
jgi:multicomponent Na+:H+ antiporter subunit D